MKKNVSRLIFLLSLSLFSQIPATSVCIDPETSNTIGKGCVSVGTVAGILGASIVVESLLKWHDLKKLNAQKSFTVKFENNLLVTAEGDFELSENFNIPFNAPAEKKPSENILPEKSGK
mgnify:CR=1 FL=1